MFPDDWLDLGIAFGLLALFVIVGTVTQVFDFDLFGSEEERKIKELEIDDASELFLLSYVKTNTNSGRINDLIRDAEDDDEKFLDLKKETDVLVGFGKGRSYNILINYPSGQKSLGNGEFEEYKEIKLPNEDGDIIIVELGIRFDEGWV